MVEQSTGLRLDEYFDFVVDSSGDVGSAADVEELKKDLGTIVWSVVDNNMIGGVLTANVVVDLESRIRSQVDSDDRITSVEQVEVARSSTGSTVSVDISANSIYGSVRYSSE